MLVINDSKFERLVLWPSKTSGVQAAVNMMAGNVF